MDRRSFLKNSTLAGGAIATASLATPAVAQGKKQWIAVSAFGKAGLLGQALESFASAVGTLSGGALTIDVYHAGELVAPFEALDAVQAGTAQMGYGAPYYWAGKSDSISFVACMPFGLNAQEQNAWCYYAGGIDLADKTAYNPLGLKFLPLGNSGNQMGGWYNKDVTTLADLQGLKFRMPGLGGEVLKSLGTNVVLLPGPDVVPAISSGTIDGTEWIGPAADLGKGLHKVCKHYYYPGWHEPGTCLEAFINLKYWNLLSNDLKRLVEACCIKSNSLIASEFFARNSFAIKKLKDDYNVDFVKYPDDLLRSLRKKSFEVVSNYARKDEMGKKIYDNIMKFRKLYMFWSEYSEKSFLESRI